MAGERVDDFGMQKWAGDLDVRSRGEDAPVARADQHVVALAGYQAHARGERQRLRPLTRRRVRRGAAPGPAGRSQGVGIGRSRLCRVGGAVAARAPSAADGGRDTSPPQWSWRWRTQARPAGAIRCTASPSTSSPPSPSIREPPCTGSSNGSIGSRSSGGHTTPCSTRCWRASGPMKSSSSWMTTLLPLLQAEVAHHHLLPRALISIRSRPGRHLGDRHRLGQARPAARHASRRRAPLTSPCRRRTRRRTAVAAAPPARHARAHCRGSAAATFAAGRRSDDTEDIATDDLRRGHEVERTRRPRR